MEWYGIANDDTELHPYAIHRHQIKKPHLYFLSLVLFLYCVDLIFRIGGFGKLLGTWPSSSALPLQTGVRSFEGCMLSQDNPKDQFDFLFDAVGRSIGNNSLYSQNLAS